MKVIINWLETLFNALPLAFLEIWGRFGFLLGLILMLCAFGGLTFKPGGRWGLGHQQQSWDAKALLSIILTVCVIPLTGYIGSSIVLVPGAQTFESLKDLMVFLCLLLFGYPALLAVPPAYMLADLIEGTPPDFLLDWSVGYFINPACFWLAYQLIGKDPDFRIGRTWGWYLLFVAMFVSIEPPLWGYICSGKFTPDISYRNITPALLFTTSITWLIAPFAMLGALPLAKKYGMFWAHIPGHVKEKVFGQKGWIWESGLGEAQTPGSPSEHGMPIRMFLATPFIVLMMLMVGTVAYVSLRGGETAANQLASRLHREIAVSVNMRLDDYLDSLKPMGDISHAQALSDLLGKISIGQSGRVFILDRNGHLMGSSKPASLPQQPLPAATMPVSNDAVEQTATEQLFRTAGSLHTLKVARQFHFDVVTAKPLSRETWLAQATPYHRKQGNIDWLVVTAIPEADYLGAIRASNSQSAMVQAIALALSLLVAALLANVVAAPIRRISRSAQAIAQGDLAQRAPAGKLEELQILASSFNHMAEKLQRSMLALKTKVTEQEHTEEALRLSSERLQLATRAAAIGIWEWNVPRNELIWDDAMYRIYGISKDTFGGAYEAWSRALHPDDQQRANEEIQATLENRGEFATEFRIIWPDGSVHFIKAASHTIRDSNGKPLRMIGVNYDVTESRLQDEELRRHRSHLEELVVDRTTALTSALDQAEAANRAKSTFLSNMSHELRTPLNAVIGFSRLLSRADNLSEPQRRDLEIINRSGNHLLTLINEVLDLSKIDAGRVQLQIETLDLGALLADVTDMFRVPAEQAGLQLALQTNGPLGTVQSDAAKLRQVLINLIGNAIKFTPRGSVTVSVDRRELSNSRLRLDVSVSDTGIGIAAADQQQVFEPFVQLMTHASASGTGLGLTITKQYLKMMGSHLQLESVPGQGSIFHFSLHLAKGPATTLSAQPSGRVISLPLGERGKRLIVADDTAESRELLLRLLQPLGFEVAQAQNGREALALTTSFNPDLILMDWRMPEMDGLEATRQIRAQSQAPQPKIIMLTASTFEQQRLEAMAAGVDEFIGKPLDENKLFPALEKLLQIHFLRDAPEPAASKRATPLTRQDIESIPADLRQQLWEAIQELNQQTLLEVLTRLERQNPGLAAHISEMAAAFQFRELWALFEQ